MSSNGKQEKRTDAEPTSWLDGVPCPACHQLVDPVPQLFETYFDAGSTPCPFCSQPLDLWAQTTTDLKTLPASWVAFRLLGAVKNASQRRPGSLDHRQSQ
jgi:hypothetical protein